MTEQWRPVPSLPGYEASDLGNIRRTRRDGRLVRVQGDPGPCGFITTDVNAGGEWVCARLGTLVAEAWHGPRPDGTEVRRLDGDPLNDRADNLAYGSADDVRADHRVRAEREREAGLPELCPLGHQCADSWLGNWGQRFCPACRKLVSRDAYQRNRDYHRDYYERNRERFTVKPAETACVDCGATVEQDQRSPGGLFLRCDPCRTEVQQEYARRYRERNPQPPAPPRQASCQDCGTDLPPKAGTGPVKKRCAACEGEHKRAYHRAWRRKVGRVAA